MPASAEARDVDVIGGRFEDLTAALAARHAILASGPVPPGDVAVRPLGTTHYDRPIEAYVLAGRFPAEAAQRVVRLMRDHGGVIITRRTEWKPRARMPAVVSRRRPPVLGPPSSPTRRPVRKRPRRPAARLRVRAAHGGRRS